MKFYVVSDIHSFYTELISALTEKGFFEETEPHKLIICGDLFDRGEEALKLQSFVLDLMKKNEVILIRGNHEDLLLNLIDDWDAFSFYQSHHKQNGTVGTVLQLAKTGFIVRSNKDEIKEKINNTPVIKQIIPSMLNYYETKKHIFVHGWIACNASRYGGMADSFSYNSVWRDLDEVDWKFARWFNGMEAARQGVIVPNKTIVCGHWHSSYGHSKIEGKCSEFGEDADFSPYIATGIVAIDACTAHSHKVNCIVIEDEEIIG